LLCFSSSAFLPFCADEWYFTHRTHYIY
jgi:hypothetical protein